MLDAPDCNRPEFSVVVPKQSEFLKVFNPDTQRANFDRESVSSDGSQTKRCLAINQKMRFRTLGKHKREREAAESQAANFG